MRSCIVVFVLWAAGASGQTEVAVGGGYHAGIDVFDLEPASSPTVDARLARWSGDWGVAGRVVTVLGERGGERTRPTYVQALVLYRHERTERTEWHVGFGGGLVKWGEVWGGHWLAVETFISRKLSERVSLRGGVSAVVPLNVHPVMLVAYRF